MSKLESFWTIRFSVECRQDFYQIPRGRAAQFDEAIQLLRTGPGNLTNVEQVGENEFQYRFNGYRIAFQIILGADNAVRVIAFKEESST